MHGPVRGRSNPIFNAIFGLCIILGATIRDLELCGHCHRSLSGIADPAHQGGRRAAKRGIQSCNMGCEQIEEDIASIPSNIIGHKFLAHHASFIAIGLSQGLVHILSQLRESDRPSCIIQGDSVHAFPIGSECRRVLQFLSAVS